MEIYHIAIDGPTASGKGTTAKMLSEKLGLPCLDTGAMYRGAAIHIIQKGIDPKNEIDVTKAIESLKMDVTAKDGVTYISVNGRDVTAKLRENTISRTASKIAVYPAIRAKMVGMQQQIAKTQSFILEGRDICNVVLPNAKYKFLLTAKVKTRVRRRLFDLAAKGETITIAEMTKHVRMRDRNDRKNGGYKKPKGAIKIDSTHLSPDEVADKILKRIRHV